MKAIFYIVIVIGLSFFINNAFAEDSSTKLAGEFLGFGIPIPLSNYYFAKGVIMVYNKNWTGAIRTKEELDDRVWEELLLSYEVFRRNIEVTHTEIGLEIDKTLRGHKVSFKWREDKEAYTRWIKEKLNCPIELFENQITHLVKILKLRQQVFDSIEPEVKEEEAFREFLNEYNTLSLELVPCDTLEKARTFYEKMKDPVIWEKESKNNSDLFKRPGFVSLEFLINMWGIPQEHVYKMLLIEINSIYPPAPIYSGKYGVFRILKKRLADETKFPKLRQSYYDQMRIKKKYEGFVEWLKRLKEEANIKVYLRPSEVTAKK